MPIFKEVCSRFCAIQTRIISTEFSSSTAASGMGCCFIVMSLPSISKCLRNLLPIRPCKNGLPYDHENQQDLAPRPPACRVNVRCCRNKGNQGEPRREVFIGVQSGSPCAALSTEMSRIGLFLGYSSDSSSVPHRAWRKAYFRLDKLDGVSDGRHQVVALVVEKQGVISIA